MSIEMKTGKKKHFKKENLTTRIVRILENTKYSNKTKRKGFRLLSKIGQIDKVELKYIIENEEKNLVIKGIAETLHELYFPGEIKIFKGTYGGSYLSFNDSNYVFEGYLSGKCSIFKGENAGSNSVFSGYRAGEEAKFIGENAGNNSVFSGEVSGYKTLFTGLNAGENVNFTGFLSGVGKMINSK